MYRCTVSFWDGAEGKNYEEGNSYNIDLDHMSKLGVLKRFEGAEEAYKNAHKVKKVEKIEKAIEEPVFKEAKITIQEAVHSEATKKKEGKK